MNTSRIKRSIAAGALVVGILAAGALPASAFGSGSGIGGVCGGGWAWSSWYSSNGYSYASTSKSGAWCNINAAIRIYTNDYNHSGPTSADYTLAQRYGTAASGGSHWLGSFKKTS